MFLKLDYISEEKLSYDKDILLETMLINKDNIEKDIMRLRDCDINIILENIHDICLKHLRNYRLELKDYFPKISDDFFLSNQIYIADLKERLSKYLLKNSNLNLYLSYDPKYSIKNTISFNKSCKNYFSACNSILEENMINSKISNLRTTFKEFRKVDNLLYDHDIFYKKGDIKKNECYEIYSCLSNIFIYTLERWNKCKYNYTRFERNYTFKYIRNFYDSFLRNNLDLKELYFFERIYNINYSFWLYFNSKIFLKDLVSTDEVSILFDSLLPVIYLPNVFENYDISYVFIKLYENPYRFKDIDEFKNGVKRFWFDFGFYFIPLYNMLYSNILYSYCKFNKNNIHDFINTSDYLKGEMREYKERYNNPINPYKYTYHKDYVKYNKNLFKEGNLNKSKILKLSIGWITTNFDISLFNKTLIFNGIGKFNKNILSSIILNNHEYQKNLKKFILSILNSENIQWVYNLGIKENESSKKLKFYYKKIKR